MTHADFISLAKHGDTMAIAGALAQDPTLADAVDESGVSALLWALYHGHPEPAHLIHQARIKWSLFEYAALGDTEGIQRLLAENPESVNDFSPDGFTPLGLAAYFGKIESASALLDTGAKPNVLSQNPIGAAPLHSALASGHVALAKLLVERGAEPNLIAAGGWTPLHYSADLGDVELTQWLMMSGATHGHRNAAGKTAAEHAHEVGHEEVARYLHDHAGA